MGCIKEIANLDLRQNPSKVDGKQKTVLQTLLLLNEFYCISTVIFKQNPNTTFLKFKLNI